MDNKVKYKGKSGRKPLMKENTLKRLISFLVAVVLLVSVVGYFIYFTGLPARVLTGAEIYRTQDDGTVEMIDKAKVAELNYYFAAVYNQYSQVGLVNENTDLDQAFGEDADFSYRDLIYESAAETMMMAFLTYRAALETEGFEPRATDAVADDTVELLRENAAQYGITVDDFLDSLYGRGMTLRTYRAILEKELVTEEFRAYMRQNEFYPTLEEVEALFEEDSSEFTEANFNYFYFPAAHVEGGDEEQIIEEVRAAEQKAKEATARAIHAAAFREACRELGGEAMAGRFADGRDPTMANGYTKSMTESINPQIAEFIFAEGRQTGDTTVIVDGGGAFAVYFGEISIDETPAASYRTLFFENPNPPAPDADVSSEDLADLIAQAQSVIDQVENEEDFVHAVQTMSDDMNRRLTGGLVSGALEAHYTSPEQNPTDADIAFAEWLFAEDRAHGDMYIMETPYGVNVIYFRDVLPVYLDTARDKIISNRQSDWEGMINPEDEHHFVIRKRNVDFARY